ncbi:amidase [Naasia aerilata]|uniref:Amidase n=1 Tax=Naasia aerilata TaxID=1162966 RepID=A0ABM8G7V4_9MICO|nr:amidase [Naasia aerilata]BDZ44261.1 amidase [Naasia aerilata]
MFELHHLSAQDQWDWLQRRDVTPVELAEHYLRRIERLNPELGALSRVDGDLALDRARALDRVPRAAELWGLPLAEKELSRRAGFPATGASRALADTVAEATDELVEVLDTAGAVSLGATTAPEFGLPSYTEPIGRPPARNPYDLERGPGGSSGGAAVAVAAGLLPFAPGSDGGGSVRIPAAATGLVGIKPTRGLVPAGRDSLGGLVVPGPLARSVADAAMLLDAMIARRGEGVPFPSTLRPPDPGRLLGPAVRGEGRFTVGVTSQSPWDDAYEITVSPEAQSALAIAREALDALGHGVEEASLPDSGEYPRAFRALWQAGAGAVPLDDAALEHVEPLTAWLVRTGRDLRASVLAEALDALARFERALIARLFGPEGARLDAMLTPALALTPRPIGWWDLEDGERNFEQQVQYTPFTSFLNATGLPAITLPIATTEEGLPMGVQLFGRPGGEDVLVSIGRQLERRFDWQRRHPPQW